MPITIDVHQGGEWTAFAMLAATGCLVLAAIAQAFAAFRQAAAADRQAKAADRQAQAARRAIIESITMTDDAAMPALMLWIETSSPTYVTMHIKNVGLGVAQQFALGYWVDGSFVKSDDLSNLYLPCRYLGSGGDTSMRIDRKAMLAEGGLVLRYESSQHTQINERLDLDAMSILSVKRLEVYRPYATTNFLD